MASRLAEQLYEEFVQHNGAFARVQDGDTLLTAQHTGIHNELMRGEIVHAPYVLIAGRVQMGDWWQTHSDYTPRYWTKETFMHTVDVVLSVLDRQRSEFVSDMLNDLAGGLPGDSGLP
jgi:hypothetical protein